MFDCVCIHAAVLHERFPTEPYGRCTVATCECAEYVSDQRNDSPHFDQGKLDPATHDAFCKVLRGEPVDVGKLRADLATEVDTLKILDETLEYRELEASREAVRR